MFVLTKMFHLSSLMYCCSRGLKCTCAHAFCVCILFRSSWKNFMTVSSLRASLLQVCVTEVHEWGTNFMCVCIAWQWGKAGWKCELLLINSPLSFFFSSLGHSDGEWPPLVAMAPSSNPSPFMCLCRPKGTKQQVLGEALTLCREVSVCHPVHVCVCVRETWVCLFSCFKDRT